MSKKILEVDGSATRDARDYSSGSFHSAHKLSNISLIQLIEFNLTGDDGS